MLIKMLQNVFPKRNSYTLSPATVEISIWRFSKMEKTEWLYTPAMTAEQFGLLPAIVWHFENVSQFDVPTPEELIQK
jgi:hypothetical protein